MEDPRCTIAAIGTEDPRCNSMHRGVVIEMEDHRCKGLLQGVTLRSVSIAIEDPRYSIAAVVEMEDPRCSGLRYW